MSELPGSKVAWVIALPGLLGIAGMLLNGWHADRTGERGWHTAIPLLLAGLAYLLVASARSVPLSITLLIVRGGCMFAYYPVFWSMPTQLLSESAAARPALVGSIPSGTLEGSSAQPRAGYLKTRSGSLTTAFAFIGGCYLVSGCILPAVRIRSPKRAEREGKGHASSLLGAKP